MHVEFTVNGETVQSESRSRYPKADGYQYIAAGKIESIFPVYGEVGGGAVIDIRGEDLKPSYRCRVGETAMGAHFISSTLVKCEAPAHYEDGVTVDVSNPNGVFNQFSDVEFQYAPRASVESIQPRMGNSQGGTVMTVSGRNFASTNALRCRVGTVETSGVWRGSHQVECVSPAMQPSPPNSRRGHPVQISSNQKDFTSRAKSSSCTRRCLEWTPRSLHSFHLQVARRWQSICRLHIQWKPPSACLGTLSHPACCLLITSRASARRYRQDFIQCTWRGTDRTLSAYQLPPPSPMLCLSR